MVCDTDVSKCKGKFELHLNMTKNDGLEARQSAEPQNKPLFDVELYLTVHKSFASTSLNIIHRDWTQFHLSYPYWTVITLYERKYNELNHRHDRAQINIKSDKNITQWVLFSFHTIGSW